MPSKIEIAAPNLGIYNYNYTKSTRVGGPKFNFCSKLYNGQVDNYILNGDKVTEYYSYFDEGRSYYKSVVSNLNGEVEAMYLSKYGKEISEYYTYRGGTLVVKNKFKPYPDFSNSYLMTPTSYPVSYTNSEIYRTFGPNAVVSKVYEKNNQDYYEITNKYDNGCQFYEGEEFKYKTSFYVYQVNGSTFDIEETAYYIDSINSSNLVWNSKVLSEKSKRDFNSASNEFDSSTCKFTKVSQENILCSQEVKSCWDGTPVGRNSSHACEFDFCSSQSQNISLDICDDNQEERLLTFDFTNYIYDPVSVKSEITNYLSTLDIVMPLAETFGIRSIYGINFPDNVSDYVYRKDFYSNSENGQEAYKDIVNTLYYGSLVQYSANNGDDDFEMSVFDKSKFDKDKIENIITTSNGNRKFKQINSSVLIDDQLINSSVFFTKSRNYYYPTSYSGTYPASYPSSYPTSYPVDQIDLNSNYVFYEIFEYSGFIFLTEQSSYTDGYINNFTTYRTSNQSDMNTIRNFIQTM